MQIFGMDNKTTVVMIRCYVYIELGQNKHWVRADTGCSEELKEGNIIDANLANYTENKFC